MDLRRIAALFNEKPWEYGPISRICSRFMSKSDRLLEQPLFFQIDLEDGKGGRRDAGDPGGLAQGAGLDGV